MIICITSSGEGLDAGIDFRFEAAQCLLFLDGTGKLEEAVLNRNIGGANLLPLDVAQEIIKRNTNAVITGNIGPRDFSVLNSSGVKIFSVSPNMTVREAFELWYDEKITPLRAPTKSGSLEGGEGQGLGRAFGGGRGDRGFRVNPQKGPFE